MRQASPLLYGLRLAQQYKSSKDCQRSRSALHDGSLHGPFPTNTPCPPFPLFQGHGFGTGPPAGGYNWNALIFHTGNKPIAACFFFSYNLTEVRFHMSGEYIDFRQWSRCIKLFWKFGISKVVNLNIGISQEWIKWNNPCFWFAKCYIFSVYTFFGKFYKTFTKFDCFSYNSEFIIKVQDVLHLPTKEKFQQGSAA